MLSLSESLRDAFTEPFGRVYTDSELLLAAIDATRDGHDTANAPLIAVGDVVTYHLRRANREPTVALIDGKTERSPVEESIREALEDAGDDRVYVENPAGSLTRALLEALREGLADAGSTVIAVEGEEDLAALPAIVTAPIGASVVYGQPGEGMVHVPVNDDTRGEALGLFRRLDGDVEEALELLGVGDR